MILCWKCHFDLVRIGNWLGDNAWAMPAPDKVAWLWYRHAQGHPTEADSTP